MGVPPLEPHAFGGWGQSPQTPKHPQRCRFPATRLCLDELKNGLQQLQYSETLLPRYFGVHLEEELALCKQQLLLLL